MRKHTKKEFKEKVEWFITNKSKMGRERRWWYLSALEDRYYDHIPEKYTRYSDGVVEYVNHRIRKMMKEKKDA
jgi:hypothetical protein